MLTGFSIFHLIVIAAFIALDVVALVQVWRDSRRQQVTKVIWTIVIVLIPVFGAIGWLINWSLAKLTDRLNKNIGRAGT